jgi:YidC/Oxa1 family membrane protein insertase
MDKKVFFTIFATMATFFIGQSLVQYYWGEKQNTLQQKVAYVPQQEEKVGGVVKIPTVQELQKPINVEIAFDDTKISKNEIVTEIETDLIKAKFSSFGGILSSINFKKHIGKNGKPLRTIYEKGGYDQEQRKKGNFLLALEEKTPFFYDFIERKSVENKEVITYKTETTDWIIKKEYGIHNNSYKIDVSLECVPKHEKSSQLSPRLFFVAPILSELQDDAITPFIFNDATQSIEKQDINKVNGLVWYWATSKVIFGAEDQYFAHTIVNDESKFIQRAYFHKVDEKNLLSVLEGQSITEKTCWNMSFYMGPKLCERLDFVDSRLSDLLSFGWLSWFCTVILKFLSFIYHYVGNFGLAIILLSILLRIPFIPLSIFSRGKMEIYQKHQPFIQRIRTKYRQDPAKMQQEFKRYHDDHGLSPATPMIGCLPVLLQIPILFSLYRVLGNYLNLYQSPFFGWIVDLSAKDPYYILPIFMGISMLWQQHVSPTSNDGKQKIVMWFMSIVVTVIFSGFPAGLVLYWITNNIMTAGEDSLRKTFFT